MPPSPPPHLYFPSVRPSIRGHLLGDPLNHHPHHPATCSNICWSSSLLIFPALLTTKFVQYTFRNDLSTQRASLGKREGEIRMAVVSISPSRRRQRKNTISHWEEEEEVVVFLPQHPVQHSSFWPTPTLPSRVERIVKCLVRNEELEIGSMESVVFGIRKPRVMRGIRARYRRYGRLVERQMGRAAGPLS